jgi:hypothetical protein
VSPTLPHDGELEARKARDLLGLRHTEPIADIVSVIEARLDIPVFLTPLPGAVAGLAHRVDGRWYVVGDSAKSPPGRLRFTLAHELGHVWMNHTPSVDDDATLDRTDDGSDAQEVEANYFAAELLMPREMVFDHYGARSKSVDIVERVVGLASLAGTTIWVAFYRLGTCDLVAWEDRPALKRRLENEAGTRSLPALSDTVSSFAQTGLVRKPDSHLDRVKLLGDLAPGVVPRTT